jgi:hypothetical protein
MPTISADGRLIVVSGRQVRSQQAPWWSRWLTILWPEHFGDDVRCVAVLDVMAGRERLRVRGQWHGRLLDDGARLLTSRIQSGNQVTALCIWEVGAARAWYWTVTAVIATAGLGWVARRVVRARQSHVGPR